MTFETTVDGAELKKLVAEVLDVDADAVTPDADFVDDLGADSLLALELTVVLERRYQVRIDSTDIVDVRSLRDTERLLSLKLGQP